MVHDMAFMKIKPIQVYKNEKIIHRYNLFPNSDFIFFPYK